jgi:hypothetical protein
MAYKCICSLKVNFFDDVGVVVGFSYLKLIALNPITSLQFLSNAHPVNPF